MQKRLGIIIFLMFFSWMGKAQQLWNFPEVDQKSYALFAEKKWDELITFSSEARQNGIDFFYLQARTGIAWYNQGKFRIACEWFLKAWEADKSFDWLQEYLYYSLVYSGRSLEALKLAKGFTPSLKQKIGFDFMKPLRVSLETGISFNPDFDQLQNNRFYEIFGENDNYGEGFFLKNYHFETIDYSHQLAPGVNLNQSFTNIMVSREEQIFWGNNNSFSMKINQKQYFLNPYFLIGKNWYFSPSLSYVWGNYDLILGDYYPNTFYTQKKKYSDIIFSLPVWFNKGNISPGAELNFANVSEKKFTQLSAWVTWYPFSNTNLYLTPRIYFKSGDHGISYNTVGLSGGFQLGQVHFFGQYLKGNMENFIESGGYVIANLPGMSNQKISGSLYFPFNKKYQFVVRYINQNISENYQMYSGGTKNNSVEYTYHKHTFTAGISWNF